MSRNVQAKFGGKRGKPFRLRLSDDLMVVRTFGQRSVRDHQISQKTRDALSAFDTVFSIPEVGIEVFKCTISRAKRATRDQAKHALRAEQPVRFAGRGLTTRSGRPVLYTENLFVQLASDVSPAAVKRVLGEFGLKPKRELDYAANAWFVELPEGSGYEKVFQTANDLLARAEVLLCHPELVQEMAMRVAFPQQWHLKRTTVGGNNVNEHANVESAWELSEGEGVTIAVIDDGVDMTHAEFAGAGKIVSPRDVTRGNDNPTPGPSDNHGTACAGVACANGARGASGVAPRARLMPIRLASNLGSQAEA
ncbi:MAG: S8 family serine peptidase, partial [Gammaproteobacteria bacterium]|nr:S8 family serine peptidase [Gammaproteobacteria bacterium]